MELCFSTRKTHGNDNCSFNVYIEGKRVLQPLRRRKTINCKITYDDAVFGCIVTLIYIAILFVIVPFINFIDQKLSVDSCLKTSFVYNRPAPMCTESETTCSENPVCEDEWYFKPAQKAENIDKYYTHRGKVNLSSLAKGDIFKYRGFLYIVSKTYPISFLNGKYTKFNPNTTVIDKRNINIGLVVIEGIPWRQVKPGKWKEGLE